MADKPSCYNRIKKIVDRVKIIDTHEHLIPEKERIEKPVDPLTTLFPYYASADMISAGMDQKTMDYVQKPQIPLKDRWEKFETFWEEIQNTGYARVINVAIKDIYGVDGLNSKTYRELTKRMMKANRPGLYKWIMKKKANIEIAILNQGSTFYEVQGIDRSLFEPVLMFQDLVMPCGRGDIMLLSNRYDRAIHTLQDLVRALEEEFAKRANLIVGVKIGIAYERPIYFEKTTFSEAERVFNRMYHSNKFKWVDIVELAVRRALPEGLSLNDAKPLHDFMFHRLVQLCIKHDLPIQIHTGMLDGNESYLEHSNPLNLVNLFLEYKEAKFDIFHGSYPYIHTLAVLAKNFPNVYVDMCWLHAIAPSVARSALSEWLDTVPSNKIMGFGGDYGFVEGVYGHLMLAKENIARVLAEKLEQDGYTEKQVSQLAQRLLRDNPYNLFLSRKQRL